MLTCPPSNLPLQSGSNCDLLLPEQPKKAAQLGTTVPDKSTQCMVDAAELMQFCSKQGGMLACCGSRAEQGPAVNTLFVSPSQGVIGCRQASMCTEGC